MRLNYEEELERGQVLAPKTVGVIASTHSQKTQTYKVERPRKSQAKHVLCAQGSKESMKAGPAQAVIVLGH